MTEPTESADPWEGLCEAAVELGASHERFAAQLKIAAAEHSYGDIAAVLGLAKATPHRWLASGNVLGRDAADSIRTMSELAGDRLFRAD